MAGQNETVRRPAVSLPARGAAARTPSAPPSAPAAPSAPIRAVRIRRGALASVVRLLETERYVLGRHDAADLVFDAEDVSRLHGVLRFLDGGWRYEDYGSQNGSTLWRAGTAIGVEPHLPVALVVGDTVALGGEAARIELLPDSALAEDIDASVDTELSPAARAFSERVALAARTRVPVFLLGPSGVGKTFTARQIHEASALPGPFIPLNCARLPSDATALHSELLGHVRGAYTGAEAARTGKLIHADGGTLFLDEVESLPALAQGFLLDVLEGSGDLAPLGAHAPRLKPITFRLISASKAPLGDSGLRPDLCERLAEGHLWRVPTLEERTQDIPGLVRRFADEQQKLLGTHIVITPAAVRFCVKSRWAGQVRQLRATVIALAQLGLARAMEAGGAPQRITLDDEAFAEHLRERERAFGRADTELKVKADARSLSAEQARAAVLAAGGSVARAARELGIARNTLSKKVRGRG
jgi:transcriptional regulator with AAA-type ATPase domain